MPTVMELIDGALNRSETGVSRATYEKSIVPQLVEGARIKLKTDDSYYQTVNGYDLASGELYTDETSYHHKKTRYGVVYGEPCMRDGGGCIIVPLVLDGNAHPTFIDINGVAMVRTRKMAA